MGSQKSLTKEPFKTAQSVEKNLRTNFGGHPYPDAKEYHQQTMKFFVTEGARIKVFSVAAVK